MDMDTAAEPRPGDDDFDGFRMRLPEDCVEYMLFVIGDKTDGLPSLETVRKAADQKLDELARDYIWQREPFKLETKVQKGALPLSFFFFFDRPWLTVSGLGLPYLHGTTHYGDNVEDEWLIVYILRELSKSFPNLWVRVSDSDGEFLLIEAAKVTPKWLSPENDSHRVWIHAGKLLLIPAGSSPSQPLSLHEAITTIKSTPPAALTHSPLVEAEAFYRLEKYPAHIPASLHHAPVTIPRKLAHILHACPKSVAPAVEAFYTRDPRALKPLLSQQETLTFPPTDLVTVSVRFTKVLYAQLKAQHFPPPPVWRDVFAHPNATTYSPTTTPPPSQNPPSSPPNDADKDKEKTLARLDLGMKLTTGFELLSTTADTSPNRVVREVALLLADLAEDGEAEALPSDEEIAAWEGVGREDDEGWMDVDFEGFERTFDGKGKDGNGGLGDKGEQEGLRRMVERFEAFLNDEGAGVEGAEVEEEEMDEDDDEEDDSEGEWEDEDEDREVSFDEEMFARMMREMMGLPGEEGGMEKGKQKAVEEDEDEDEDEDDVEEIRKITEQLEAELKGHGALQLDPKPKTVASIKEKGEGPSKAGPAGKEGKDADEDSDDDVDIDYNLAKNLLESFKSQAGMAGPAGNLLGLMGMSLPRDEEDADDEQK